MEKISKKPIDKIGKIKCDCCGAMIGKNFYFNHLKSAHEMEDCVALAHALKSTVLFSSVNDIDILSKYFKIMDIHSTKDRKKYYASQFRQFYRMITSIRKFEDSDLITFKDKVLPWQLTHPKTSNSKEFCSVVFEDKVLAKELYEKQMLSKNPFLGHDGSLSPFSKDFNGYKGMTEEEKTNKIIGALKCNEEDRTPTQILYWVNKHGCTIDEAKKKVTERQTVFSKEICIQKYGEEDGMRIFNERQAKWQASLNDKPIEEIERINRAKNFARKSYSNISQELFWKVYESIKDSYSKVYFATLDQQTKERTDKNSEYFVCDGTRHYFLDFYVKNENKVIEFDGDYWHSEQRGNLARDTEREENLKSPGFDIYRVKECDFLANPSLVVENCLAFIRGQNEKL